MIARTAAPRSLLPALTGARILAVPAVMALILSGPKHESAYTAAAVVFAVAASTDFADGYLARRWAVTTKLGSFLDTTADKVLVTGVLIALVSVGRASAWVSFVIIAREIVVFGLKGVASSAEGSIVNPSRLGKAKANLQFLAIFVAIWRPDILVGGRFVDEWLMWVAAIITVWSGIDYVGRYAGAFTRVRER